MLLEETRDNVRPKGEGNTAVVLAPARDILVGVGPEKIAQQTAVGNLDRHVSSKGVPGSRSTAAAGQPTSVGRITRRICSIELRSGLRPPCMVKIFSSMMAAMGRQLKQSVNVFHSLML